MGFTMVVLFERRWRWISWWMAVIVGLIEEQRTHGGLQKQKVIYAQVRISQRRGTIQYHVVL